jgi:hypothetical protein
MVKNPHILEAFEREETRRTKCDFEQNMRIFEALYEEAVLLGVFPSGDPLEGIDLKIKIARILNGVR